VGTVVGKPHHPVKIGPVSLSYRERQLYMEILNAQRLGEPTTAKHLTRMMRVHHDVSGATIGDLLLKLLKKRVIWWERSVELPYNPAEWKVL
jgi:hypothetical protein